MQSMKRDIEEDESKGVHAVWQDESYWNQLLSMRIGVKILDSSYCYVQQPHLQKLWKIDHLKPKILALEKNHSEIRS